MCSRVREDGETVADVAEGFGISPRTVQRWLVRWDAGEAMTDRSSAPHRRPNRTPPVVEALIETLRRRRWTSTRIAAKLRMPTSTVCAVLQRIGLNRLWRLEPPEPPNRYCRRHPGELIHVDIKKLGRFHRPGHRVTGRGPGHHRTRTKHAGWEFVHVAVDDTSRLAYAEVLADERGSSCVAFLRRAVAWFANEGVIVKQVMTDNGSGYCSKTHRATVAELGIRHLRTQPYRPRTNGKAERFIQTLQREWAYSRVYRTSNERRRALPAWIRYYNTRRPHSALGHKPPTSRLTAD
jgi:transposase InsO family protein